MYYRSLNNCLSYYFEAPHYSCTIKEPQSLILIMKAPVSLIVALLVTPLKEAYILIIKAPILH